MVIEYRPAEKPKKAKKVKHTPSDVVKRGPGRPPTGFDSKAYGRAYMKDKRAALKLGLTVREYRKQGKET